MRQKTCHLEKEVIRGLKVEELSPEIEKHTYECTYCQDIVTSHKWMNQFKDMAWNAEILERTLPDPESVWNRAQVKKKPDRKLVKKALRPLIYPRVFSYVVIIIGVILFLSNLKKIGNVLDSSLGAGPLLDALSKITQIFPYALFPMVVVVVSVFFCVFVVAVEKLRKTV